MTNKKVLKRLTIQHYYTSYAKAWTDFHEVISPACASCLVILYMSDFYFCVIDHKMVIWFHQQVLSPPYFSLPK